MPITIKRINVVATRKGSDTLYVQALQVWIATLVACLPHDIVEILSTKGNNQMKIIPGMLRRDSPEMYYKMVKKHEKWLENHWNIQIFLFPKEKYEEMNEILMMGGKFNAVHWMAFGDRLNISTMEENFDETRAWVYEVLNNGCYIGGSTWNVAGTVTTDDSTLMSNAFSKYGIDDDEMTGSGSKRSRTWETKKQKNLSCYHI